jgi:hypothetical protein
VVRAYGYGKIPYEADFMMADFIYGAGLSSYYVCDMTHLLSPDHPHFFKIPIYKGMLPPAATAEAEERLVVAIQSACEEDVAYFTADLSSVTQFPRPHPYPVGQAYIKLCGGEETTAAEKDIFTAQMLRCLLKNAPRYGAGVAIKGVSPSLFARMKAYFTDQKIVTPHLLVAVTPADAIALAREGAGVALEIDLYASEGQISDALSLVAAGMPLGMLKGLYLPVTGLIDLPLADRAEQIFCGCLAAFGEAGTGPADAETQRQIADKLLLT